MKDISKKLFWQLLILLVIIRVFLVIFIIFHIIPLSGLEIRNHIIYNPGGDEHYYFVVSKKFSHFNFQDKAGLRAIGTFVFYAPFIWLTGAENQFDLFPTSFIFQSFVMYSLAIIFVGLIASLILRRHYLGIFAGFIFVFSPFFFLLANFGPYAHNYNNFLDLMWLRAVLSDAPSAFFVYLAVFLYFLEKKNKGKRSAIYSGLAAGAATLIRLTNILICFVIGVMYLFRRKYKEFLLFFLFSFTVFSLQLLFNKANYGGYLKFGRFTEHARNIQQERYPKVHLPGRIAKQGLNTQNYLYLLTVADKYIPGLGFVLFLGIVFLVISFYYVFRINKKGAVFLFLWFISYVSLYGAFDAAARNLRYYLPVVPVFVILLTAFINGIIMDLMSKKNA